MLSGTQRQLTLLITLTVALLAATVSPSQAVSAESQATLIEGKSLKSAVSDDGTEATRSRDETVAMSWAQTQADWYVNDDPYLSGPSEYWYTGNAGHGYGSNNFVYTYAIGGESPADNWATWYMGTRVGRQQISVYVPTNQATATVKYEIFLDNTYFATGSIAQSTASGWTTLGSYDTNGADVIIIVEDNRATQHHRRDGLAASRIGIDAIAMRCVARCTSRPSAPTGVRFDSGRITWNAVSGAESYGVALCIQSLGCVAYPDISCCSYTPSDLRDVTHINVYAVNSAGHSEWSQNVPIPQTPQLPDAPTGLDFRSGQATWNPVAGADSYIITLCENHGGARQCPRNEAASCCSYAISDPRIVQFLVRAVNSAGEGTRSDIFDLPARKPAAPTGVRVTSGQATWNSVSGADSYEVALCTPQGCVVHDDIRSGSFAISDPTATYIKVRVVNSAGHSEWSQNVPLPAAQRIRDAPTGVRFDSGHITWNAVSDADRYDIAWKLGTAAAYSIDRGVKCCVYRISNPNGRSVRISISAVNQAGNGPWTAWTTVLSARRSESQVPGTVTGLVYRNGKLTWQPARRATDYLVALRWGILPIALRVVDCCGLEFPAGISLRVTIKGRNSNGDGPWSPWQTIKTDEPPPQTPTQSCPTRDKYRIKEEGGFLGLGKSKTIYANKAFKTTIGRTVQRNEKGGKVSGLNSLSQNGCSWVFPSGEVNDDATVKDNAVVFGEVHGEAVVSGNAQIKTRGEVFDQVEVSGNAIVHGRVERTKFGQSCFDSPKISGNAEVYGRVYCGAEVKGSALISKDMEIKGGRWNGREEYARAAEDFKKRVKENLKEGLSNCSAFQNQNEIDKTIAIFTGEATSSFQERNVEDSLIRACRYLKSLVNTANAFKPNGLSSLLSVVFALASTLRLGVYARSFLEVIKGVKDIVDLNSASSASCKVLKKLDAAIQGASYRSSIEC